MSTTAKIWLIGLGCGVAGALTLVGAITYIRNH